MSGTPPRSAGFVLGAVLTAAFIAMTLLALVWTPYDPSAILIADKLQSPNAHHWFGTDQLGRDVLSMIMAVPRTPWAWHCCRLLSAWERACRSA